MMTEGTIITWLKKEGEEVAAGTPLFEMETDKLTITMDAEVSGTLLKVIRGEGEVVPITEPIAIIGAPGEDISGLVANAAPAAAEAEAPAAPAAVEAVVEAAAAVQRAPGERVFSSPRARLRAEENGVDIAKVAGSGPEGYVIERDVKAYLAAQPAVTPLAANMAKAQGIDLAGVNGTGVGGKITTADLCCEPAVSAPVRGSRSERMSGMRKAISRNMLASKETNAQTHHRISVDMTAAMEVRKQLGAMGTKVSYNDIIVRVCAQALRDFPIVNASVDGEDIIYHDYANVGVAVSVPGGLIVPVIKDADLIGLKGIAQSSAQLIDKARDGKLTAEDYHGGTFTVSSLGMFGLDEFVAIINPPESAILAVGRIAKTPVVVTDKNGNDEIVIKPMCALTLSYDHRIIDGAEAARFLQRVQTYLQNPALLI